MENKTWIWVVAGAVFAAILVCGALAAAGLFLVGFGVRSASQPVLPGSPGLPVQPAVEAEVELAPTVEVEPAPAIEFSFENELSTTTIPIRDRHDLAVRFNGLDATTQARPADQEYTLGQVDTFFVNNSAEQTTIEIEAELLYISGDVYAWVEVGEPIELRVLQAAIDEFAQQAVPTALDLFAAPDFAVEKFHVLHTTQVRSGVAGYYYSPSEYTREVIPTSNEKSMFFINLNNTRPQDSHYNSVLAHEFQHLVHWHQDQNEETWLNEGYSELAARIGGYGISDFIPEFSRSPGSQLTDWPDVGSSGPYYGASYLYVEYLYEEYGEEVIRALASEPSNGLDGVDVVLEQGDFGVTADDVFADWVIANYLNQGGIYGYSTVTLPPPEIKDTINSLSSGSFEYQNSVTQYGTDYLLLDVGESMSISFAPQEVFGEEINTVPLVYAVTTDTDDDPTTDDRFVWWSNRGDDVNPRLTGSFDLSDVDSATLSFDAWFDIEELWDYAYVSVSTDGGVRWDVLESPCTTAENPYGNAYSIGGYTGLSSNCSNAIQGGWIEEELDLSDYAGQEILLRFEIVTDDAVNKPGLVIDNIAIPEINFFDDGEAGEGTWEAEGFILTDNALRQRFIVQVISYEADGSPVVQRMMLNEDNLGQLDISSPGEPAILAVSGATRYTTEFANYIVEVSVP